MLSENPSCVVLFCTTSQATICVIHVALSDTHDRLNLARHLNSPSSYAAGEAHSGVLVGSGVLGRSDGVSSGAGVVIGSCDTNLIATGSGVAIGVAIGSGSAAKVYAFIPSR